MNDSFDIVNILLIYRIPGISLFQHGIDHVLEKNLFIKSYYVLSVSHNIMSLCIIKGHDILDHLCLVLLNDTLFMSFIHNRNDLLFCDCRFCTVYLHTKRYCCQSGNPGDKHSKRFQQIYPEIYQIQISVRISFRMIRTHSSESQDANRCKQNHTYRHHQYQRRQMFYVWMKCIHCPWNQKCTKTDSACHNDQRNRIDKLCRLINQCHQHLCFLITFISLLLCIILTYVSQCCGKSIKNPIQPQQ